MLIRENISSVGAASLFVTLIYNKSWIIHVDGMRRMDQIVELLKWKVCRGVWQTVYRVESILLEEIIRMSTV